MILHILVILVFSLVLTTAYPTSESTDPTTNYNTSESTEPTASYPTSESTEPTTTHSTSYSTEPTTNYNTSESTTYSTTESTKGPNECEFEGVIYPLGSFSRNKCGDCYCGIVNGSPSVICTAPYVLPVMCYNPVDNGTELVCYRTTCSKHNCKTSGHVLFGDEEESLIEKPCRCPPTKFYIRL